MQVTKPPIKEVSINMRARYYEPGSGRFLSPDPGLKGMNFFVYCDDNPVSLVDQSGKDPTGAQLFWYVLSTIFMIDGAGFGCAAMVMPPAAVGDAILMIGVNLLMRMGPVGQSIATSITDSVSMSGCAGVAAIAVLACAAFSALCGFLALQDNAGNINGLFN